MAIRIGGSCGGRYSRPILGITTYENRILQNNEHKYFWEDAEFCIKNKIFLIVTIDSYVTGGRWNPSNQALRDFVISVKTKLKGLGATKLNCRFSTDNESEEWTNFRAYCNWVRVIHDALNGEFDLGAGNFGTNARDWYSSLAKEKGCYEVFDFHMQNGLTDETKIIDYTNWIYWLCDTHNIKRFAVTEGNNFYNVETEAGHSLLKKQIERAEFIGCEDFCFVYANFMPNSEESDDDMSYNRNFTPSSDYWPDMLNIIKLKKPKEVFEIMNIELNYVKPGSKNEETRAIQQIMIDEGYDLGSYGADGIYGTVTGNAIKKWQTDNGLTVDGICGRETWQWIIFNIGSGAERFLQLIVRKAVFK